MRLEIGKTHYDSWGREHKALRSRESRVEYYRVVRYRRENDIVHGVTRSPGHKYTPLVGIIGDDVRMVKVPNDEVTKYFSDVPGYGPGLERRFSLRARRHGELMHGGPIRRGNPDLFIFTTSSEWGRDDHRPRTTTTP